VPRGLLLLFPAEVAMLGRCRDPRKGIEAAGQLFRNGHRAVLAAGASDRDRGVPLVLPTVPRQHRLHRREIALEEFRHTRPG